MQKVGQLIFLIVLLVVMVACCMARTAVNPPEADVLLLHSINKRYNCPVLYCRSCTYYGSGPSYNVIAPVDDNRPPCFGCHGRCSCSYTNRCCG
jgi:hypothetical protein